MFTAIISYRYTILSLLLLLSFTFMGFTSGEEKWKVFKHEQFTISYPSSWKMDDSGQMSTKVILQCPLEDRHDNFTENVNVISESLPHKISLDEYTENCLQLVKQYFKNYKLISTYKHSKYNEVTYTGELNGLKLKWVQHYYITSDIAWVITFASTSDDNDRHLEAGMKIMKSFTVK